MVRRVLLKALDVICQLQDSRKTKRVMWLTFLFPEAALLNEADGIGAVVAAIAANSTPTDKFCSFMVSCLDVCVECNQR